MTDALSVQKQEPERLAAITGVSFFTVFEKRRDSHDSHRLRPWRFRPLPRRPPQSPPPRQGALRLFNRRRRRRRCAHSAQRGQTRYSVRRTARDRPQRALRRCGAPRNDERQGQTWKDVGFNVLFKGSDWQDTEKGETLERDFAALGVEVVYFPYTPSTSSSALRRALQNIELLAHPTAVIAAPAETAHAA
jgi:hypothetical protein